MDPMRSNRSKMALRALGMAFCLMCPYALVHKSNVQKSVSHSSSSFVESGKLNIDLAELGVEYLSVLGPPARCPFELSFVPVIVWPSSPRLA